MAAFRYQHGDRPLEGYTIQRAVGRGGFGEVYYAVSDSGREVALKAIQSYEQIELRGVSHCMNLKSPHLITVFDVKHNADDTPFVIMEYVAGPSLRELLDESPAGLGPQKAAFFLREIAKGLTFLHDRGIVHRDLKPGNIFYEDGYVKIGDYGLSKAISESHCSGQTITVGTVHYMAPEIGQGRYDKSIDIYALGVVLYEMLTGQTPYLGATPTEVLMKHLTGEPGVAGIEEPFATVIRKAMAKDPADRYQSAQEMVEAVFGAEHVRNSVSHFRPESLSVAAERVAGRVALPGTGSSGEARLPGAGGPPVATGSSGPGAPARGADESWEEFGRRMGRWGEEFGRRAGEWGQRFGDQMAAKGDQVRERLAERRQQLRERVAHRNGLAGAPAPQLAQAAFDPLDWNQRRLLGITTAALMGAGSTFVAETRADNPLWLAAFAFVLIAGAAGGIVGAGLKYLPSLQRESGFIRRLAFTGVAALCSLAVIPYLVSAGGAKIDLLGFLLAVFVGSMIFYAVRRAKGSNAVTETPGMGRLIYIGPFLLAAALPCLGLAPGPGRQRSLDDQLGATLLCVGAAVFLTNWRALLFPSRQKRVSLGAAFRPAIIAWLAAQIFDGDAMLAGGIMAGIVLVVQVTTPFEPRAVRTGTAGTGTGSEPEGEARRFEDGACPLPHAGGTDTVLEREGAARRSEDGACARPRSGAMSRNQLLPTWATVACLILFVLMAGVGILLLAWLGMASNMGSDEEALAIGFGVSSLAAAVFFLVRGVNRSYRTLWTGLVRPLLLMGCGTAGFTSIVFMANARMNNDETLIALAFIVFPGLVFLVLLLTPARVVQNAFSRGTQEQRWPSTPSNRRRFPAVLLAAVGFLGIGGLHRFYVGKTVTGVVWLCTFGLLYVGTLIDIIRLLVGTFRDEHGRPLLIWYSPDELGDYSVPGGFPVLQVERAARRGELGPVAYLAAARAVNAGVGQSPAPDLATVPTAPEVPTVHQSSLGQSAITAGRVLCSGLGGLVMFAGLLVGVAMAIRLPELLATGWPDPGLANELKRTFGTDTWYLLATRAGEFTAMGVIAAGMLLVLIARRGTTGPHAFRAVLGSLTLIVSCQALKTYFEPVRWWQIVETANSRDVGPAIELLRQQLPDSPLGVVAALLVVLGNILLVWGPRTGKREEGR